jgi:hypothetical protein
MAKAKIACYLRFDPDDYAALEKVAQNRGMTVAAYLIYLALESLKKAVA